MIVRLYLGSVAAAPVVVYRRSFARRRRCFLLFSLLPHTHAWGLGRRWCQGDGGTENARKMRPACHCMKSRTACLPFKQSLLSPRHVRMPTPAAAVLSSSRLSVLLKIEVSGGNGDCLWLPERQRSRRRERKGEAKQ